MNKYDTSKKLFVGIFLLALLSVCLCITTVALVYSTISVENNIFGTGYVDIDLLRSDKTNEPIIKDNELVFAPGMSVQKDFFIVNKGPSSVYYKLYFEDVDGNLANVVDIVISDGNKALYKGTATQLSRKTVKAVETELKKGEEKKLTITFIFPENIDNAAQGQQLEFSLCAEAVQYENNPGRNFN